MHANPTVPLNLPLGYLERSESRPLIFRVVGDIKAIQYIFQQYTDIFEEPLWAGAGFRCPSELSCSYLIFSRKNTFRYICTCKIRQTK